MVAQNIYGKFGDELKATANAMVAPGKGLLAADESTSTIGKRFDTIQVENVESNRQAYRQLLFTTDGFEKYISGVIMYEETLFQKTDDGKNFTDLLKSKGVLCGIKLDKGPVLIPGDGKNTVTQGLDGLAERCAKYYAQGARFAKWRAVIEVSDKDPSDLAITLSAQTLARYAAICQTQGLVPIVEPETMVLVGKHSIERSLEVTTRILNATFYELNRQNVSLERMILKPNFVLPGRECPSFNKCFEQVTDLTLACLQRTVPPAVPGIMFLSGGLSEKESVDILNNLNKANTKKPWKLSYSYGRALQTSTLEAWRGKKENIEAGQKAFMKQAEMCSKAEQGKL
eukprot:CAMPEP_0117445448 /NCGR_PEP_ID=MMETSP0759-20121206/5802_1 /TAXON_ID=63605 /ORGANISM="Percolomonas cosmopolitus, Strain WS" /LENGTH=342 /DNA_ID=CAMNT_0005237627 /DNA_START=47 /DNA_END=1075 /DNA_ORIENTATION=+